VDPQQQPLIGQRGHQAISGGRAFFAGSGPWPSSTENPNIKSRNPKEIRNTKFELPKRKSGDFRVLFRIY
jgi:hypothetical protein